VIRSLMGKSSRKQKRKPKSSADSSSDPTASSVDVDRYLIPIVAVVSALVILTGALTDQWRGAVITEIQVLAVGAAARWGLRS
jgi:hypothetical protein